MGHWPARDFLLFAFVAISVGAAVASLALLVRNPTHAIAAATEARMSATGERTGLPDVMSNRCSGTAPERAGP